MKEKFLEKRMHKKENKKMKIGILTYHRSINYGAFLQAYCLAKYVQRTVGSRADVEIIDYTSQSSYQAYNGLLYRGKHKQNEWKKRIGFERSRFLLPLSKESLCSDDLSEVECFLQRQNYDLIVVGSDEVWKVDGMRGFPTAYWANFDLGRCVRIAYAVSSRTPSNRIDPQKQDYISNSVKRFRYLGARDQMTVELIYELSGESMDLNCDPAFLIPFRYDKAAYREKFNKKYRIEKEQKLLGVMIPDSKLVRKIKERFGGQYKVVALYDFHEEADINMVSVNPFEWIKAIGCLDFLVTDRFHGIIFAMKMDIPFLAVETYDSKENSKLYYLLHSGGLDRQYMLYHAGSIIYDEILVQILQLIELYDIDAVHRLLMAERAKSIKFKKALLAILNEYERNDN